MKVICPISGIKYSIASPLRGHSVSTHPLLAASITCANLNEWYLKDWAAQELDSQTTHLLALAYTAKLPIESIAFKELSDSQVSSLATFWQGNVEKLAKLAGKLESRNKVFKRMPRFVVTLDTVLGLPDWLELLETELSISSAPISDKAKELNRESYKVSTEISARTISQYLEPDQIDGLVLRALRESPLAKSETKALPVILADWANKVTEFPSGVTTTWQRIIQTIFAEDFINQIIMSNIRLEQVKAVEEHLQLNTPAHAVGTSHSKLLMSRLAKVIPVFEDFNPMVSARKKTNENALIASIMGDDIVNSTINWRSGKDRRANDRACPEVRPENKPQTATEVANSSTSETINQTKLLGTKPMTLTERLAARLAGSKAANNNGSN